MMRFEEVPNAPAPLPTYGLYGEKNADQPHFWLHCETIASRSRMHRWEIHPHRHETFFQILYARVGTGEALFGDERHPLSQGSIVTVPPGHGHGFRFARDMDGLVMTFVAARVAAELGPAGSANNLTVRPRVIDTPAIHPDRAYLEETLHRLERAIHRPGIAEAHLVTALHLISGLIEPIDGTGGESDPRIARFQALVTAHVREHRPVSFYADALGVSSTHLNRIVTAATGGNVSSLLAGTLLEQARRLLVFTGLSIRDVGSNLGFEDPAYFSRFFSERAGVTPRDYRRSQRNSLSQP